MTRRPRRPLALAVATALLGLAHAAAAQTTIVPVPAASPLPPVATPTASSSGFEASGIPRSGAYAPKALRLMDGAVNLTPTLGISYGYNDNVSLAASPNENGSTYFSLTPRLLATSAYKANRYSIGYQGEINRFVSSSKDNVENHEIAATGLHDLGTRLAVNWRAAYQDRFDAAGTTDRTSVTGKPDHWHGATAVVAGRYGAAGAQGRIEAEVGYFDKKYVNNRATTVDADYQSTNFVARFLTRIAPKTSALIEYRNTQFDYGRKTQNLDNVEQRLLVGAEWEATAATSGSFKIGYLDKQYDRVRPGFGGLTWEGGVRWAPLTYSKFDFSTGRSASDPSGTTGNFVVGSFFSAGWTHEWTSYLSTRAAYSRNESKYDGITRKDNIDNLSFGANYDLRQWARLGAEIARSQRRSNAIGFDYDRTLFTVFAELSF